MATISTDSLKMTREALCVAQHSMYCALRSGYTNVLQSQFDRISALIADIDRQRPLGPDGKHGDRHTPTCGCDKEWVGA